MADGRGRPPRPKSLGRYVRQGTLVAAQPDWLTDEADDPVEVALAAVQHRLLTAALAETGATDPADALGALLGLDRRNTAPLVTGDRALSSEQIVRLLLWLDLGPASLADPTAPPGGSAALLPTAHRSWLARDRCPGPVRFARPAPTTDWTVVAEQLAAWRAGDPAAHFHDDGQLLAEAVRAVAAAGGPPPHLAERASARGRPALAHYHGRAELEITTNLLDDRAARSAVAAALRPLADTTADRPALAAIIAAAPRAAARLHDLWPTLKGAQPADTLLLDLQDLHVLGAAPVARAGDPIEVTCLARAAGPAGTIVVLSPAKRLP